jgi:probable addiction module antidote protein
MEILPFDIAEHLQTDADIQGFLKEVAETGDSSDFLHALNIAARAKGMGDIAKQIGVSRASLYKSLSENGNPRFDTVSKVCQALGVKLSVDAMSL